MKIKMFENKTWPLVLCSVAAFLLGSPLRAAQIQGVAIAGVSTEYLSLATSNPDRRAATNVVGSVGLNGDVQTQIPGGSMWLTASNLSNITGTNAFITFDLGAVHTISAMKVWNYNENNVISNATKTNEGVKLANISFSADNVTFTTNLPSQTFNIAPGAYSAFAQTIPVGGVSARYVRIDVITNWAVVNAPVGLAKVRFIDDSAPPTVISAGENYGSNQVTVYFSESVDAASATNAANYSLQTGGANSATILSAAMGEFNDRVVLMTSALTNQNYSLLASGVYDAALTAPITNNSTVAVLPELILWLRADVGVLTDGSGNVTNWMDQSGYGHNALPAAVATFSAPPTLAPAAVNGLSAVQFNGSQLLGIPNDTNLLINGDMCVTLILEKTTTGLNDPISKTGGQSIAFGSPSKIYNGNMPAPFDFQIAATTGKPIWVWGNSGGSSPPTLPGTVGMAANQYYLVSAVTHGSNCSWYLNGNFDGAARLPEGVADAGNPIYLGVRGDTSNPGVSGNVTYTGFIAETMLLRGTVTSTDLNAIDTYLGAKYGIAITPPLTITEQPASVTTQVGQTATFWVNVAGLPPFTYQWQSNNVNIAGATNAVYTTPPVTSSYNSVNYTVTVTGAGSTTTTPATLTVASDTTAPIIFSATRTANASNILVSFSEPVSGSTALNAANYSLNGASVLAAGVGNASNQVLLATTALIPNTGYVLAAQNVQDLAGNAMVAANVPVLPASATLWLRADVGVFTNATGQVYQWLDQTANINNAYQYNSAFWPFGLGGSSRPSTGVDFINGEPSITFTSTATNFLQVSSSPGVALVGDMSIYAVVNIRDYAASREVLGKTYVNQPGPYDYQAASATSVHLLRGNGSVNGSGNSTAGASVGAPHVISVTMAGTSVNQFVDGKSGGTQTISTTIQDTGTPLRIGSRDDFATFMNGDIAEVMIFNAALSATDQKTINNYLGVKYFQFSFSQQPVNVTTNEGTTATFSVGASQGSAQLVYQWQENSTNIAGATNATYTTPVLAPTDNNDVFDALVIVPGLTTNVSSSATLTVNNVAPVAASVGRPLWSTNSIVVVFSEAVLPSTATNLANYSLDNGASILSASIGGTPNEVVLATSPLDPATAYTLTIQNVQDLYGNTIATASVPNGIYPPGTALWIRADEGVTADGSGNVSAWNDQSGNGNNFTAGNEPVLITNAINGRPAVQFNATNETYMGANDAPSLEIVGDMTIFAVMNFTTYATNGIANGIGGGSIVSKTGVGASANQPGPYDYYVSAPASTLRFLRGDGVAEGATATAAAATTVPSTGVPHVMDVMMQGTAVTHRLDGQPNGGGTWSATPITDAGQPVYIGTRADGGLRLDGDMAELLIVSSALSSNDIVSIENYLAGKYDMLLGSAPRIAATQSSGNVVLSWPTPTANFVLEATPSLPATWSSVTNIPVSSNGLTSVTVPATGSEMFYRLQKE